MQKIPLTQARYDKIYFEGARALDWLVYFQDKDMCFYFQSKPTCCGNECICDKYKVEADQREY